MNKLIVMKIVGVVATVVVVIAGVTVVVNMNRHSNSVVVKVAQQIKPVRVNPLIAQSNRVYHFVYDDYKMNHLNSDEDNVSFADCYYKGGYTPNKDALDELKKQCLKKVKQLDAFAKQQGLFMNATIEDWLDQNLLKKISEEGDYYDKRFKSIGDSPIPKKFHKYSDLTQMGLKGEEKEME